MSLIVEDGTGVANANSYISVTDARTWASARGLTFTGADAAVEILLIKAMDLLESFRAKFKGTKTSSTQALQWPRADVYLDGVELDDDFIPQELISALVQFAYEAQSTDLQPTGTGQEIAREKVGPIETEYIRTGSGTVTPQFNKAMNFLAPLLVGQSGLSTLRV